MTEYCAEAYRWVEAVFEAVFGRLKQSQETRRTGACNGTETLFFAIKRPASIAQILQAPARYLYFYPLPPPTYP